MVEKEQAFVDTNKQIQKMYKQKIDTECCLYEQSKGIIGALKKRHCHRVNSVDWTLIVIILKC